MLRLGRGIRVQVERVGNQAVLLFPEGIVELNDSAFAILSRLPRKRSDLENELCREFKMTRPLAGFDEFIDNGVRQKWIEQK